MCPWIVRMRLTVALCRAESALTSMIWPGRPPQPFRSCRAAVEAFQDWHHRRRGPRERCAHAKTKCESAHSCQFHLALRTFIVPRGTERPSGSARAPGSRPGAVCAATAGPLDSHPQQVPAFRVVDAPPAAHMREKLAVAAFSKRQPVPDGSGGSSRSVPRSAAAGPGSAVL